MTIALKVEQALRAWVQTRTVALITDTGAWIVTEAGLRLIVRKGFDLDVPVHLGQDQMEVRVPCIVCSCSSEACQEEFPSGNYRCPASVTVRFEADPRTSQPEVIKAFQVLTDALIEQLMQSDLPEQLSAAVPDFTCFGQYGGRQQASSFDGRVRTYAVGLFLFCAPSDIEPATGDPLPPQEASSDPEPVPQ
jgi:hypothetical protein